MIKKISLFLITVFTAFIGEAQSGVNFTCNDCNGISRDLFTDLDAGKVAVLVWVMPCSNCINGALTAQAEVQAALVNYPGRVVYYMLDDYANTTCATLNGWAQSNGINSAILISNSAAGMSAYGTAGMPKIVVLGGKNHDVYYNKNAPDFTATGIRDAIQTAMPSITTNVNKQNNNYDCLLYPIPANNQLQISFNQNTNLSNDIRIFNLLGDCVYRQSIEPSSAQTITCHVETNQWPDGVYVVCVQNKRYRCVIAH